MSLPNQPHAVTSKKISVDSLSSSSFSNLYVYVFSALFVPFTALTTTVESTVNVFVTLPVKFSATPFTVIVALLAFSAVNVTVRDLSVVVFESTEAVTVGCV